MFVNFKYLCYIINGDFMALKKIYLEITNACNLNCSFCIKNNRKINYMSKENYCYIIDKIKNDTKEIYLHVLGEPLMHNDINYFIDYAYNNNLLVNITTNGYLINNIKNNKHIHRLNISIHSYNRRYKKDLYDYLEDIFNVVDNIRDNTFVSLRLWVGNKDSKAILDYINNRYNVNIDKLDNNNKIKITNNLIIDTFHEFIWPDLNNNHYEEIGTCKGLIDHIGILNDGTIIPCCLDSRGIINLGNIYENSISEVLKSDRAKKMINGFKNSYKCEELCRHCHFLDKK